MDDTKKTILRINEYHCFLNVIIPVTFKNIIHARQCYRRIFRRLRSVLSAHPILFWLSSTPLSSQDVVSCLLLSHAEKLELKYWKYLCRGVHTYTHWHLINYYSLSLLHKLNNSYYLTKEFTYEITETYL